ncbi:MAG: alpha/beta hydrolase [Fimbriimonadaceae bacterium]|nr:alpha/beta hydrolase [Fimbriimonadaceae bacterium]
MSWPFVHIEGEGRVWLLLHGTGADENDLVPLGKQLFPGAHLVSPRGPVLENGRPRWFRRFAEGEFDIPDYYQRIDELGQFIRDRKAEGIGTDKPWGVMGYSNGANIAHGLLRLHPSLVDEVVLLRAMMIDPDSRAERLNGKRVLLASGRFDPILPLASAESLAADLQRGGAEVEMSIVSAGHELTEVDLMRVTSWLSQN